MATKKLRVLVAEDTHVNTVGSLQEALQKTEQPLDLTVVGSVSTLLPSIKLVDPEIIFLDLSLAQPEPTDIVRRLHRATPRVPIIVIVDAENKDSAPQCLAEGAVDYLSKELMDEENMNRVLRSALERNTLAGLTDLLRDPLTGFHNRDAFLAMGARGMDTARRNGGSLVLLCALLKNFGALRAEFGPAAADEAIREVGEVLAKSFRETDMVARIGEAQFAVLAADAAEPSVEILRQRIEKRLAAYNQSRGPWGPLELGVSASYWSSNNTASFQGLLDTVESGLRRDVAVHSEPSMAVEGLRT